MDNQQEQGNQLHALVQRLDSCRGKETKVWLESAHILHTIHENELWADADYPTFKAFLGAHDRGYSTTMSKLQVHNAFIASELIQPLELRELSSSKLVKLAPHVNEENLDLLLTQALMLSRTDLGKWLKDNDYETATAESHESCILFGWVNTDTLVRPHDGFLGKFTDPGLAKDGFTEYLENMKEAGNMVGDAVADIYYLGRFKRAYKYWTGQWMDVSEGDV